MEHKDFENHVVQTSNPAGWKWTVSRTRTGYSSTRAHAVLDAERTIDRILRQSNRVTEEK